MCGQNVQSYSWFWLSKPKLPLQMRNYKISHHTGLAQIANIDQEFLTGERISNSSYSTSSKQHALNHVTKGLGQVTSTLSGFRSPLSSDMTWDQIPFWYTLVIVGLNFNDRTLHGKQDIGDSRPNQGKNFSLNMLIESFTFFTFLRRVKITLHSVNSTTKQI